MIPGNSLALLILLALVPGWIFVTLRQRHTPVFRPSALAQLLEMVAVGLLTTGTATLIFVAVPRDWLPFLPDPQRWVVEGSEYAQQRLEAIIFTGAGILAAASMISVGLDRVLRRERTELFSGPGVWVYALRQRPEGTLPYVGVQLSDGTLVEGLVHSFSLEATDVRDLALEKPIFMVSPGESSRRETAHERLILPEREIKYITVAYVPEKKGESQRENVRAARRS